MKVLVVGASGYVGGRLAHRLLRDAHDVRLMSRDTRGLTERFEGAEVVRADLLEPSSLPAALEGVNTAYYLAHSMAAGEHGFRERDLAAARAFGAAAKTADVRHIVYLGALGESGPGLSKHLSSRQAVGAELATHGVPVTEFRAAVVVGSGSASFELIRSLVEHVPVMITPSWVRTLCQPIAVGDVMQYLMRALERPDLAGIVEIGGPDVLSYAEMMMTFARLRGLRRLMIPVPVLTPRLSSYWCDLVTPIPRGIARPLIEGLRNEVVVRDEGPAARYGIACVSVETAMRSAIERVDVGGVTTTWFDSLSVPGRPDLLADSELREGVIVDRRRRTVKATPERVFAEVERLGGAAGWPYANPLWSFRGLVDRAVGGPGMRLGRRDPAHVRVGDAVDFWRVEAVRRPELLRFRAEMRVPGRAWLQYEVMEVDGRCHLVQTAFFEPKGLTGALYWYLLLPAHHIVFRGTIDALRRRAEAP